jgi:hypothetical protein
MLEKYQSKDFFNIKIFEKIIISLKNEGFQFIKFGEKIDKNKKYIYLRHDIDFCPQFLEKFEKIYRKHNVVSNIFFMNSSNLYNFLGDQTQEYMQKLYNQNHLIGMHLDLNHCSNLQIANHQIENTIKFYKKHVNYLSDVFSIHAPKKIFMSKKFKKYDFVNSREYFSDKMYVSDSGRKISFLEKLLKVSKTQKRIQILVHPIWWTQKITDVVKFLENQRRKDFFKFINNLKRIKSKF